MRAIHWVVVLLLALVSFSGCLESMDTGGRDDEGEPPGQEGDPGEDDGGPTDDGDHENDDEDSSDHGSDEDDDQEEDHPDQEEDGPAPPHEHEQDTPENVTRPGQYAILEKRADATDATWEVPEWEEGYWWEYEFRHNEVSGLCDITDPEAPEPTILDTVEGPNEVSGSDPDWSVSIYQTERAQYCGDERQAAQGFNRSEHSLSRVRDSGYIHHETIFPLEDGKHWVFMDEAKRHREAEVTHHPEWVFNGETVEAWEVSIFFERAGNEIVETTYYGVEVGWILKQEKSQHNTVLELIDHHAAEDDGSLVPITLAP